MSKTGLRPLVIIGGGGHASVLVDMLSSQKREILAVISPNELSSRSVFKGLDHFFNDEDVFQYGADDVSLVNGVGMLPGSDLKRRLSQYYLSNGYHFETVISENARISPHAKIEGGVQILSGAIVRAGVKISSHTIISTGVIVEHDCDVGEYNHLAPGSTLCGQVRTAESVYIGAGATVIQNTTLAQGVIVGAGAVVTQNLQSDEICYPARGTIKSQK